MSTAKVIVVPKATPVKPAVKSAKKSDAKKANLAENLNKDAVSNIRSTIAPEGVTSKPHSSGLFLVTEKGKNGAFKQYLSEKQK